MSGNMVQFEQEPVAVDHGDSLLSQDQFWQELDTIVYTPCESHERIDDTLRAWLELVSTSRDRFLDDEDDIARCSQKLLASPLFATYGDYVRIQIIYSLLQEDEVRPLHAIANFLLFDGRIDETVFPQMIEAGCFTRLVDLIKNRRDDDRRLYRLLLQLMYEMSRIERLRTSDLLHVDDIFVSYLFQMIEDLSDDASDPYHYPVIRVLLVLNEQYMVAATTAVVDPMSPAAPLTNRVVKVLSINGDVYRTFGENIILLLNRETETSLQLLILKLMYLLFTTQATCEYFYTNDLRVLQDVIVRNLLDLPDESMSLRHTYLRVFYPLLAHTQLQQPPHYKRDEILQVLAILSRSGNTHFAPADETTLRLVDRVSKVEWLAVTPQSSTPSSPSSPTDTADTTVTATTADTADSVDSANSNTTATSTASATCPNKTGDDSHHVVNKLLGISLTRGESYSSVADVASVTEKPGVKTPSRRADEQQQQQEKQQQQQQQQPDVDGKPRPPVVPPPPRSSRRPSSPLSPQKVQSPFEDEIMSPPPRPRPKRALPAVPKHRHGVLVKPAAEAAAAAAATTTTTTTTTAATAATEAPDTGSVPAPANAGATPPSRSGIKKLPPKAPPPRRVGKLRSTASNANLQAAMDVAVEPHSAL